LLEPLSKFPLLRDLSVDRDAMRTALTRAHAHFSAPISAGADPGALATLDRCTGCGACVEACPETSSRDEFVGPAALNDARFLNELAGESGRRRTRLAHVMGTGGVASCGKAQNCVEACPDQIPLFESILALNHDSARLWLGLLLRR
jgi:succinate dehydrogenase / fumarate reductase iron-sulfur subunit